MESASRPSGEPTERHLSTELVGADPHSPPVTGKKPVWPPLRHSFVLALAVAIGAAGCSMVLDWFLLHQQRWGPLAMAGISNVIFGVITFFLALRLVRHSHQQRRQVLQRLEIIDQMNHHIRNALQVIAFNARPTSRNDSEMAEMEQAVDRIHWTLREILPKVEPEFAPFEGSARAQHGSGSRPPTS